jgi:DNA helicase-2/ATP-dependent DNA helicase PcrA
LPEASVEVSESQSGFGGFSGYGSRFDTMDTFGSSYRTPGWQRAQRRGRREVEEESQDVDYGEHASPFGAARFEDVGEAEAAAARARRMADAVRERPARPAANRPGGFASGTGGGRRAVPLTIEGELVAKSTGTVSPYAVGDRVFHLKFGNGNVTHVEGNKLIIQFDKAGEKRVLDSFVERV